MSKHNTKTAIRERMKATGENYTTARRALSEGPTFFLSRCVRTNAPEVLEAIAQRKAMARYLAEQRKALALECNGQESFYVRADNSIVPEMTALAGDKPTGHGRWKKSPNGKGWVPAKGNPLASRYESLAKPPTLPIPGMPDVLFVGSYLLYCHPLVHDGYAWVGLGHDPEVNTAELRDGFSAPWKPVRPSEYQKAVEGYNDFVRGLSVPPATPEEIEQGRLVFERLVQQRHDQRAKMRESLAQQALERAKEEGAPVHAQFARSVAPEVIASIEQGWQGWGQAHKKAVQFFLRHVGATEYVTPAGVDNDLTVLGLGSEPEGVYWVKDTTSKAWRPRKDGYAYQQMRGLSYRAPLVPGATDRPVDERGQMMHRALSFVVDGEAWAMLDRMPAHGHGFSDQWEAVAQEDAEQARERWIGEHERRKAQWTSDAQQEMTAILAADKAEKEARQRRREQERAAREKAEREGLRAQYVRTTDPETVAVIEQAWRKRDEAMERISEWVGRWGVERYYASGVGISTGISALAEKPKNPEGEWTGSRDKGWRPFKSNPLYQEMLALGYKAPAIPGVPEVMRHRKNDGSGDGYFLWTTPIVVDGEAWVLLARFPNDGGTFGPQWTEALASQAQDAEARWQESRKKG